MSVEEAVAQRPRRRVLRRGLVVLVGVLVVLLAVVGLAYVKLNGNIKSDDSLDEILGDRPETAAGVNFMILGDDTREGQTKIAGSTPGLSDTNILLHLSEDRSRVYAVSVPRDLMVSRPACVSKTDPGKVVPAAKLDKWNAAYSYGGVACAVAQFEQMTDIRVDHFIVVQFEGFKDMVDALHGVPVCVPAPVKEAGKVVLPEGSYEVNRDQALAYVRIRHGVGDDSDVGRMSRQQAFLAAMVHKAASAGTMANPFRLYKFLSAATDSLTTDPDLASLNVLV